jgi:hypothetical protein
MKLLSDSNTKIKKGEKLGWKTFGLSLAPHTISGKNLCPHASEGCALACLNTAGMGVFSNVQKARLEKTKYLLENRAEFLAQLKKEIANKKKRIQNLAIRLNVLSDLPWHNLIDMETTPEVSYYDYTPNPSRMIQYLKGELPKNYHLTFSRKENNQAQCELILSMGGNVAVVFDELPKTYLGKEVVNGDDTDLRFLDKKGVVVGLKAKGKGKQDESGFVVRVNEGYEK